MIGHHVIVLLACSVLLAPLAHAQEPSVVGYVELTSQLGPEEMNHAASGIVTEMQAGVVSVTELLEGAESTEQMAQIRCLSSALTTMRALLAVTQESADGMERYLATGARGLADHEFRKVTIAWGKFQQARAEALACVGKNPSNGDTTVEVVGADLDGVDVTEDFAYEDEIEPDPPPTSQFQ